MNKKQWVFALILGSMAVLSACTSQPAKTATPTPLVGPLALATPTPPYTPAVLAGAVLSDTATSVSVSILTGQPESYRDQFIVLEGYYIGKLQQTDTDRCRPQLHEWGLANQPYRFDEEGISLNNPVFVNIGGDFGAALNNRTNAQGSTTSSPDGKRLMVWGWWRQYQMKADCAGAFKSSGAPYLEPPHWYLQAVKLQVLEPIDVTPAPRYAPVTALDMKGSTAFIGTSGALVALDISKPSAPRALALLGLPVARDQVQISAIRVVEGRAYVLYTRIKEGAKSGLQIADVSDPNNLRWLGGLELNGAPEDIAISGTLAGVVGNEIGLQIVDVHDPAHPALRGHLAGFGETRRVQMLGSLAYLADMGAQSGGGLQVVDLSNPDEPKLSGTFSLPLGAIDVHLTDNLAYVIEASSGIFIVNVNSPATPYLIGSFQQKGENQRVWVDGDRAYYLSQGKLQVVNIHDPTQPALISQPILTSQVSDLQAKGATVYIITARDGFQILDLSDPKRPKRVGQYGLPNP